MNSTHIENTLRTMVNLDQATPKVVNLLKSFDDMKAQGRNVEFRLDVDAKTIRIVEIEQITAELSDMDEIPEPL